MEQETMQDIAEINRALEDAARADEESTDRSIVPPKGIWEVDTHDGWHYATQFNVTVRATHEGVLQSLRDVLDIDSTRQHTERRARRMFESILFLAPQSFKVTIRKVWGRP